MSVYGILPRFFDDGEDDWPTKYELLEQFFVINDGLTEKKKRAILLVAIHDDVYRLLRNVCYPTLLKEKTYDELIELLNKHYGKKSSVFRERYKFYNAKQEADESVSEWLERLRTMSNDCRFGNRFDDVLRDRFISGLRELKILDRLCGEDEVTLTVQGALNIALTVEENEEQLRHIKSMNQ